MKQCREMNTAIFRANLLATLIELGYDGDAPYFRITPVYDQSKAPCMYDDMFRLEVLGEENIGGKIIPLDDTVEVLSCMSPLVPTQIKVKYLGKIENKTVFELLTSTRIRKPSQLANIDTGHPPFKAITE